MIVTIQKIIFRHKIIGLTLSIGYSLYAQIHKRMLKKTKEFHIMKKACFTVFIFLILSSTFSFAAEPSREYQVKAGFLYKFLLFAEWPEETTVES